MDAIEVESPEAIAGTEAIEVIAQFDGAIVEVTHLLRRDEDGRRTSWLVAGGASALALAALAFFCAYAGVALPRAIDLVVALALVGGSWALLRGLDRRLSERAPRDYTIGADAHASFAVANGAVPEPRYVLVRVDEAGDFELRACDGMTGTVTLDGRAQPLAPRAHKLPAGARASLSVGGAIFHIANVPAPLRQARPLGIDWRKEVYLGGVALVVSAFVFLVYAIPPAPQALALDLFHGEHFARFRLLPPQPPPPDVPQPPSLATGAQAASAGKPAQGETGKLGKQTATHRAGQLRLAGPMSRQKALSAAQAAAQSAGILGIVARNEGSHVGGALFGTGNPLGDDAPEALLGLVGTELQDGFGSGLDTIAAGPGGGGESDQTIGAGRLKTVGWCDGCDGQRSRYARSAPIGPLAHHAKAPEWTAGPVQVKCGLNASCLDKEMVRRIVRRHHNEVRFCYERSLAAGKPELAGRLVTQFTIAATGRVLGSFVTESSLQDHDVEQCIADAVRRWQFPSSQQTSVVSYPFVLTAPR